MDRVDGGHARRAGRKEALRPRHLEWKRPVALGIPVRRGAELGGEVFGTPRDRGETLANAVEPTHREQRFRRLGRNGNDLRRPGLDAELRFQNVQPAAQRDHVIRGPRLRLHDAVGTARHDPGEIVLEFRRCQRVQAHP